MTDDQKKITDELREMGGLAGNFRFVESLDRYLKRWLKERDDERNSSSD